jgi:hypothetical protein
MYPRLVFSPGDLKNWALYNDLTSYESCLMTHLPAIDADYMW